MKRINRRQFMRTLLRNGILGGMGLLVIALLSRPKGKGMKAQCPPGTSCDACGLRRQCRSGSASSLRTESSCHPKKETEADNAPES